MGQYAGINYLTHWGVPTCFTLPHPTASFLCGCPRECGDVINVLDRFKLLFIVAIRSNHGVLMPQGQLVRYNRWRAYTQTLSHRPPETRYIREIVFSTVRSHRYYEISKTSNPTTNPLETWLIMTNLPKSWQLELGKRYSLRGWIEYGFKQAKNELGWADFRVTDYTSIERWWEVVLSAYLLVSWQAHNFQNPTQHSGAQSALPTSYLPPLNSTFIGNQVQIGRAL